MGDFVLASSKRRRGRGVDSLVLINLYLLAVFSKLSISAPIGLVTSLSSTNANSISDSGAYTAGSSAKPSTIIQRMQLHVNILRRRVTIDVPRVFILPAQQFHHDEEQFSITYKQTQQHETEYSHQIENFDRSPYSHGKDANWFKQTSLPAGRSAFRNSRRKLQSTTNTSPTSSASCVDETSFITFVNKNVRDCSWVQSQGKCDTYGNFCPVTCALCNLSGSESLLQVLNTNLQGTNTGKSDSTTTGNPGDASGTSSGGTNANKNSASNTQSTSNGSINTSNTYSDASIITANGNNKNNSKTSSYSSNNSTTTLSPDLVLVKLSFTTLTDSQRKSLTSGRMSINDINTYLVTADDIQQRGNGVGAKLFDAILMSISQILVAETDYVVSDGNAFSTATNNSEYQNNTVLLKYNSSLYNNNIANDGSNGWVNLNIPYEVTAMSYNRRHLSTLNIQQINELCNVVIQKHITDGTLLDMLILSTNSRIKAVSLLDDEVTAAAKPRNRIAQFFKGMGTLTYFAIGVFSVVLVALLVLWGSFTLSKMKQRKLWRCYEEDAKKVILRMELENRKSIDGSKRINDTTFDSSIPFADENNSNPPSTNESSISDHHCKPSVCASSKKDVSDISTSSSRSGRLNRLASNKTAKISHRWIPSIEIKKLMQQRKVMKQKSVEDVLGNISPRVENSGTYSPEVRHQQMHFHIATISGPPTILKQKLGSKTDDDSMTGTIFGRIQRRKKENGDDGTASILMSSNGSSWGDEVLPDDLAKIDEVVFSDSETLSSAKISQSGSVHYIDTPGVEYGFSLSGYIDQIDDAVFDALYNSDTTSIEIASNSEDADESVLKSFSSNTNDSQNSTSLDKTNDYINRHDIVPVGVNSEPSGKTDVVSSPTTNKMEDPNTYCDESLQFCYQEIANAFSNFWSDPRGFKVSGRKLITHPTTTNDNIYNSSGDAHI